MRKHVALISHSTYLFPSTIRENITNGRKGVSFEDIVTAAESAYAHDFIMEQTEGYQTPVGEHGAYLSGGQRQRIAIARALLKNAPILLLDEATSTLDSESEQLVQKALDSLMVGRTTIAVAHRLSTIQNADMIYVLENGRIVERGNHEELLQQDGLYYELYKLQFNNNHH